MRILHVERKTKLSGQALRVLRVVRGLRARGHEVGLACQPGSALGDAAERDGIPVCRMSMVGMKLFASAVRLRRHIRASGYQVVNAHGARAHILTALALVGVRGVAIVRTKHNAVPLHSGAFSRLLYHRGARVIIAISDAVRQGLVRDGVRAARIETVFTGIDTARFSPRPKDRRVLDQLGLSPADLVLGLVARLGSGSVRTVTLLRAFHQLAPRYPHARLLLVGRGTERLSEYTGTLGLADRVHFPGFVRDVPAMLSVMDLYVQPNVKAGLGTAVIEAMAMGKPVVATRVGGHPEVVVDGRTGRLCPPEDPRAMAEAIASLLDQPRQLPAMGQKGRERVQRLFDQDRMVAKIERIYQRVAAESPR